MARGGDFLIPPWEGGQQHVGEIAPQGWMQDPGRACKRMCATTVVHSPRAHTGCFHLRALAHNWRQTNLTVRWTRLKRHPTCRPSLQPQKQQVVGVIHVGPRHVGVHDPREGGLLKGSPLRLVLRPQHVLIRPPPYACRSIGAAGLAFDRQLAWAI